MRRGGERAHGRLGASMLSVWYVIPAFSEGLGQPVRLVVVAEGSII